jgi:hypothetical protein
MKDLKIRCSALGKIMTNPRTKGEVLSSTCKSYIEELFDELEYGYKKAFNSRYTNKGIQMERHGIALANTVLGWGLDEEYIISGGQETFENEYVTGHTDICTDELLADIKCSFTQHTFPEHKDEIPNNDYIYQLQGYMWLTGHSKAELVYCQVNTPEHIVEDEIRREHWNNNLIDYDEELAEMVRMQHNFDRKPIEKRVKRYIVERNDGVINRMKERIILCREYYESLKNK